MPAPDARVNAGMLTLSDAAGDEVVRARGEALLSDGRVLSTLGAAEGLEWRLEAAPDGLLIRLVFTNRTTHTLRLEQLRPLVAPMGYRALRTYELRIQSTGWQSWSRAHPPTPFESNAEMTAPPIRGPYLPHRAPNSQLEPWMTVLEQVNGGDSTLFGFVSARHQLGTIELIPREADAHALIAATEMDGVQLAPEAEVVSEPLLVAAGATDDLLELYARMTAEQMQARPTSPSGVMTGWCSWYQLYTNVSEADVLRNVDVLAEHRELLPLQLVQLDDGYQRAVGDWLTLNDKFPSGMPALVERIRASGFVPGLWLAPFVLGETSQTYAEHPDWVVRDARGKPLNAIDNWGTPNYALDTTHPDALDWVSQVLRTVCDEWGFEYLKLDFLYAAAMRGRRANRHLTAVEAYRMGLERVREVVGHRFVLGCGAPLLPSIGLVDGMRIGADVAAYWGEAGNGDGPSLLNATRATLARMWMHRWWWSNDPDCVLVRETDSALSLAEIQAWASIVALSGGMLFVGDDLSKVAPERLDFLARLLPPSAQAARGMPPLMNLLPSRIHLRLDRPWGEVHVVGLANWGDVAVPHVFVPAEFGLPSDVVCHVVDLWSGAYLAHDAGSIDLGTLEAHAIRLLSVRADLARPQTVGSTGHLLGDAVDLMSEAWDPDNGVLTLVPNQRGPRARHAELLVFDPRGPLRRVPFSSADGPIELHFAL